ncbi:hypothetical protein XJ27_00870 [Xanthomonas hortorum]|nr:hypothetical protein XJ27_00870 [Xanthomonas hortorum]
MAVSRMRLQLLLLPLDLDLPCAKASCLIFPASFIFYRNYFLLCSLSSPFHVTNLLKRKTKLLGLIGWQIDGWAKLLQGLQACWNRGRINIMFQPRWERQIMPCDLLSRHHRNTMLIDQRIGKSVAKAVEAFESLR